MVGSAPLISPTICSLSQRALQIETEIRRLLRRYRAIGSQEPSPEHVIAGAVDGLDTDQLPALVAERGESPLLHAAAQCDVIIAGGETRYLQLVAALIAPEPRRSII